MGVVKAWEEMVARTVGEAAQTVGGIRVVVKVEDIVAAAVAVDPVEEEMAPVASVMAVAAAVGSAQVTAKAEDLGVLTVAHDSQVCVVVEEKVEEDCLANWHVTKTMHRCCRYFCSRSLDPRKEGM